MYFINMPLARGRAGHVAAEGEERSLSRDAHCPVMVQGEDDNAIERTPSPDSWYHRDAPPPPPASVLLCPMAFMLVPTVLPEGMPWPSSEEMGVSPYCIAEIPEVPEISSSSDDFLEQDQTLTPRLTGGSASIHEVAQFLQQEKSEWQSSEETVLPPYCIAEIPEVPEISSSSNDFLKQDQTLTPRLTGGSASIHEVAQFLQEENSKNLLAEEARGSVEPEFSKGSAGHPNSCALACKYARKARGCKDGADCDRCHLCKYGNGSKDGASQPKAEPWVMRRRRQCPERRRRQKQLSSAGSAGDGH